MFRSPRSFNKSIIRRVLLLVCLLLAAIKGQTQTPDPAAFDRLLAPYFKANEPGAAVIVTQDGKTIFRKAYGMANVELGVALTPDMVFRLGSLTKQVTAAAIFMLADEGKLAFNDDIGKYLPEFASTTAPITIMHLLTHRSGVGGYTEAPEFDALSRSDLSVAQILALVKKLSPAFAPGERVAYSNSGYALLGAIIEKVSGQSYADFVESRIFTPLGMHHTRYDRNAEMVRGRVTGYTRTNGALENAGYVNMTSAYAAGGLRSTVDDLVRWNQAMATGKLLKPESWALMFQPYKFTLGAATLTAPTAFGRVLKDVQGVAAIDHGGRINGFVADGLWLPSHKVYVAVLANNDAAEATPSYLSQQLAALAIGKPYPDHTPVNLNAETLDRLVGVYRIDASASRYVTREGNRLFIERTGGRRTEIIPTSATEFFYPFQFTRVKFQVDERGDATHMDMMQNGSTATTPRVSRIPRVPIRLPAAALDRLVGEYVLGPDFVFTITREGEKLMAHITGQNKLEVLAKSETRFYYTAVEAELEFTLDNNGDKSGRATALTLHQDGKESKGTRR